MTYPKIETPVYTPEAEAYLAGPMRFAEDYNFPAFYLAEVAIEEQTGLKVFNPARNDCVHYGLPFDSEEAAHASGMWLREHLGEEFDLRRAIYEDLRFISLTAKAVYVLPGWEASSGVRAEKATAECLDIPVYEVVFHTTDIEFVPAPKTPQTAPREERVAEAVAVAQFVAAVDHNERERAALGLPEMHTDEEWAAIKRGERVSEATYWAGVPHSDLRTSSKSGEVREVSSTGGEKGAKLARYDLIPIDPLRLLAEHFGRGARKYADHNWRRGYKWSLSYSALCRHLADFWSGKEYDVCPDDNHGCRFTDMDGNPFPGEMTEHGHTCFNHTGSLHIVAAIWHTMVLTEFANQYPEFDDRFKGRRVVLESLGGPA